MLLLAFPEPAFSGKDGLVESLYLYRNGVSLCFLSSGFCRLNWTFLTDWSGIRTLPTADSFQGQGKDALVRQENAGV